MSAASPVLVFDPKLWGGRDVGDNSQFWKPATILAIAGDTATVRFHHDGRISTGHFLSDMRPDNPPPPASGDAA